MEIEKFLRPWIDYVMNNYENSEDDLTKIICTQLQNVYDPEFPLVDIFTLGLIYSIIIDSDDEIVEIILTYTTPACPEWELIQQMIIHSIVERLPTYTVHIDLTFDPLWSLDMIKDPDLKKLLS